MSGSVSLKVTDNMAKLHDLINSVSKLEVYVGIPEENTDRQDGDGISNAELAFIHTNGVHAESERSEINQSMSQGSTYNQAHQMFLQANGSDLYNVPARPIIEPAIEKNKDAIAKEMQVAATLALDGKAQEAKEQLENVGDFASGKVREFFTDPENGWEANAESTIKEKGSDKPLIDTGELRKSITYLVGDKT